MGAKTAQKRRSRAPLFILLGIVLALTASLIYGLINADELGDTPRGALANELDISLEQADTVLWVLEQCGVADFESVEHDALLDGLASADGKGYRVDPKGKDANNVILYMKSDGSVDEIRWADNILYTDGKAIAKLYHDLVIEIE